MKWAQSTLWVSQNFFNENQFIHTTKAILSTEDSRQAIASTIVDACAFASHLLE